MDTDGEAIKLSKYQHIFLLIKAIQHAAGQHIPGNIYGGNVMVTQYVNSGK